MNINQDNEWRMVEPAPKNVPHLRDASSNERAFASGHGGEQIFARSTALLFIEYQNDFTTPGGGMYETVKPCMESTNMLANSAELLKEARECGALIIHCPISFATDHCDNPNPKLGVLGNIRENLLFTEGTWGADFHPSMMPHEGDLILKGKKGLDAFPATDLEAILKRHSITTVAIGGYLTNCCVESTMRTAYEKGFNVITLVDCCAAATLLEHEAATKGTFTYFSERLEGSQLAHQLRATANNCAPCRKVAKDLPAPASGQCTAKLQGLQSRCPCGHGTVRCETVGYVQGRHPAICKYGCVPAAPGALDDESLSERLLREALEYNHLFHVENHLSHEAYEARKLEISEQIGTSGRYEHTFAEIEHGARVAWRNAGKCINRQVHMELRLHDCREVTSNAAAFEALCDHLRAASAGAAVEAIISVFPAVLPTGTNKSGVPTAVGPRVWNGQLVRFAGYKLPSGGVLGDPSEIEFTQMLQDVFGWTPPSPRSQFDVLPLVLQMDPDGPAELFELPPDAVRLVDIVHPRLKELEQLGLRWYAIPAVSSIDLSLGGLHYTAAPFNGWYMTTEIATRNLGDADRYNMLPKVAKLLGLDVTTDASMWKEHALAYLNEAVAYSFGLAGVSIANHHSLAESFATWHKEEAETRGYCPANWKWLVPPTAGSTCPFYMGGNKFTDYTLFPAYLYSPGWKAYLQRALRLEAALPSYAEQARKAAISLQTLSAALRRKLHNAKRVRATSADGAAAARGAGRKCQVLLAFGGSQGATKARAHQAASLLSEVADVRAVDLGAYALQGRVGLKKLGADALAAHAVLLLTSTCGSGDLPTGAEALRAALAAHDDAEAGRAVREALGATPVALYGRGNSSYARYNRGGDMLDKALRSGATPALDELVSYTRGDELSDEAGTFHSWLRAVVGALVARSLVAPAAAEALLASKLAPSATSTELKLRWKAVAVDRSMLKDATAPRTKPPLCGTVTANEELLKTPTFAHSTRLLTIDFARAGRQHAKTRTTYAPGDHVKVYAETPMHLVELAAAHLGIALDAAFDLHPDTPALDANDAPGGGPPAADAADAADAAWLAATPTPASVRTPDAPPSPTTPCQDGAQPLRRERSNDDVGDRRVDSALRVGKQLPFSVPTTYRVALTEHLALLEPPPRALLADLAKAADDDDAPLLRELATDSAAFSEWLAFQGARVLDLFDLFPSLSCAKSGGDCRGAVVDALVTHCAGAARPRFYSVASSQAATPESVALLLSRVNYRAGNGQPRTGFASGFLTSLPPGVALRFEFEPCRAFHLPEEPTVPLLMVAAGTGASVFRGFLLERLTLARARAAAALPPLGAATLLFGCRQRCDQLLSAEVDEALAAGALSEYLAAFSREASQPKQYVQHLLLQTPRLIEHLTHDGGHLYICGDANMAAGVQDALVELTGQADIVEALRADGRYHEDVFGAPLQQSRKPSLPSPKRATPKHGASKPANTKLPPTHRPMRKYNSLRRMPLACANGQD